MRVILGLTVASLALAGAETALRGVGFRFQPYTHREHVDWDVFVEGSNEVDYVSHRTSFWRLRPNHVVTASWGPNAHIESHGFRGTEVVEARDPHVQRIIAFGDSGTFGWCCDDHHTYPRYLARWLTVRPDAALVEVVNAGVPGYTSFQGLGWVEGVVPRFRPDLVLIAFGGNDPDTLDAADAERRIVPAVADLQQMLLESRLYQFLWWNLSGRRYRPAVRGRDHWVRRVDLPDFATNLRRIAAVASTHGARTLFVARRGGGWESEYMETVARVASEAGAPYEPVGIDGHPPCEGYEDVARRVAALIDASGSLAPTHR